MPHYFLPSNSNRLLEDFDNSEFLTTAHNLVALSHRLLDRLPVEYFHYDGNPISVHANEDDQGQPFIDYFTIDFYNDVIGEGICIPQEGSEAFIADEGVALTKEFAVVVEEVLVEVIPECTNYKHCQIVEERIQEIGEDLGVFHQ